MGLFLLGGIIGAAIVYFRKELKIQWDGLMNTITKPRKES